MMARMNQVRSSRCTFGFITACIVGLTTQIGFITIAAALQNEITVSRAVVATNDARKALAPRRP